MSNFKQLEDQRNDAKSQDRNSPNTARQAFGLLMNSFLTVESQRTNLFIHTDAEEKSVLQIYWSQNRIPLCIIAEKQLKTEKVHYFIHQFSEDYRLNYGPKKKNQFIIFFNVGNTNKLTTARLSTLTISHWFKYSSDQNTSQSQIVVLSLLDEEVNHKIYTHNNNQDSNDGTIYTYAQLLFSSSCIYVSASLVLHTSH